MPFGSFAGVAVVGWMWYVVVYVWLCDLVSILRHSVTPVSHSGARCLRSLLEKWMGLHCCLISVSYSFVPMVHWMVCLFLWRVSSVACDAIRMVVAMALSHVRDGRLSRCRFVIVLAMRITLSVGNLCGLDSSASVGHWLNCFRIRRVWE